MDRKNIYEMIDAERNRQFEKFGPNTVASPTMSATMKLGILAEEVGEVAKEVVDAEAGYAVDAQDLRAELTQVAAVAVAWLESL